MLRDFQAGASLVARGVDVSWRYATASTALPPFRLVRRPGGPPTGPDDGHTVVDFAHLHRLAAPPTPWERIEHWRMVAANVSNDTAELEQATLELFFAAAAGAPPARAVVAWWDGAARQRTTIDELSRVVQAAVPPVAPFTRQTTLEIFATPGGGAEVSVGLVRWHTFAPPPADPVTTPSRFEWTPAGGPTAAVPYHTLLRQFTLHAGQRIETHADTANGPVVTSLRAVATNDPDAGATEWTVEVAERELPAGRVHYYRLFSGAPFPLDGPDTAQALATDSYGMSRTLFELLPPAHQIADGETPQRNGRGQLERFLTPFGAALDHVRGLIDGLPARHDLHAARADVLPHLSRMIGWDPDLTAPARTQRQDLAFAAELFAAVGTRRSPGAIVNRVTGWPCAIKEFANNVLLTNAPEGVPLWEIWQIAEAGGGWGTPAPLTLTSHVEGDPAVAVVGGTVWVVWHSDRSGRRELWYQRLGVDLAPRRVMAGAPDDAATLDYSDEAPAAIARGADLVLFWTSTRDGSADVWTRLMTPAPGAAEKLTDHPRTDRHPAAVRTAAGTTLFWSSDRRGVWDIWLRELAGGVWGAPARLRKDPALDRMPDGRPAAVVAPNGELWLFWSRDMGDRREIWHQANNAGVWGPQLSLGTDLTTGQRDEAPCPVVRGAEVWLLFHSNRAGPWQIWSRRHDGAQWRPAVRQSNERTADMEPAAYVDGGGMLHVFWSSQRRAPWYRSRTIDFADAHMLAEMGTFDDHAHYVYDTGVEPDDWYSRGGVGLYLTPPIAEAGKITEAIQRTTAFLEPFRPAPVRFVWPLGDVVHEEPIDVGNLLGEDWVD